MFWLKHRAEREELEQRVKRGSEGGVRGGDEGARRSQGGEGRGRGLFDSTHTHTSSEKKQTAHEYTFLAY